jgi:hypothetical protein
VDNGARLRVLCGLIFKLAPVGGCEIVFSSLAAAFIDILFSLLGAGAGVLHRG